MYITINGIRLYKRNEDKAFCEKLLDINSFDGMKIEIGTIVTTAIGSKYEVIKIKSIDLNTACIEVVVREMYI